MPDPYGVGGGAQVFSQFLQGVLQGKGMVAQKEATERSERFSRVGQLFDASNAMRAQASDKTLKQEERDRLYGQAQSLWSSAMQLSGQLDDKPTKAGKKENPFMQFLGMMNPFAKKEKVPGEFDENFAKIVNSLGPGGIQALTGAAGEGKGAAGQGEGAGMGALTAPTGAETPAAAVRGAVPGDRGMSTPEGEVGPFAAAAATRAPVTPGGPVGGYSSATEGEVGGFTAAAGLQPRPTSILNADGTRSSERSITVQVAEINSGRATNIPTIYGGEQLSDEDAIQRVVQSGGTDPETGRRLPSYNTVEEAVTAAGQRSDALGRAGPPVQTSVPGEAPPPYVSKYFQPDEDEVRKQKFSQLSELYRTFRSQFQQRGIDTVEKLRQAPGGQEIIQQLMFLAAEDGFDGFDELDEVYAGLGLQPARTAKDQFEEGYFRLAELEASGTPLNEQQQKNLQTYRRLRRAGSATPETPDQAKWQSLLQKHGGDVGLAYDEWVTTTTKEGTQGYKTLTAVNPATGRSEILKFNNRTGDTEWTGITVPSDFTIDDIMSKDIDGVEYMDGRKIRFHHENQAFDDKTLEWLLEDMPDQIDYLGTPIDNPEKERLQRYFDAIPEIAEVDTIKQFAVAKNMSYEEARTELERQGLKVNAPALESFRERARGGG